MRFDGGMNLSTGADTAFNASGNSGMTLVVTDTVSTSNILTTTTGTALNVASTTIGAERPDLPEHLGQRRAPTASCSTTPDAAAG